jgi:cytochrome c peroxidase
MKKFYLIFTFLNFSFIAAFLPVSMIENEYAEVYFDKLNRFEIQLTALLNLTENSDVNSKTDIKKIQEQIYFTRKQLKSIDFWLRYLEPVSYKKINGQLPVEWEFELNEKPRKKEGAGLTLAALYLEEEHVIKDSLLSLIRASQNASKIFSSKVITSELQTPDHFFYCNRLYLLNLAAIYTTGFECPDTGKIISELKSMLTDIKVIYKSFNESFPETKLDDNYLTLYNNAVSFAESQPDDYSKFDHYTFIKEYVNPLFIINQQLISKYKVNSRSNSDRTINNNCSSIFSKDLFRLQNSKGIFKEVKDENTLSEIDHIGKLLFYDPLLSGNNQRSCVSCHISKEYFSDTSVSASLQFNRSDFLSRNTPSLVNVVFNQLLMLDGKHVTLQMQAQDVITNPVELNSNKDELLEKILSCPDYNKAFNDLKQYSSQPEEITFDHIISAITFYYSKFSEYNSTFDESMNGVSDLDESTKNGFNLFMSKAKCGTCHFVPHFNGVKPPFVSSEFEALGVPEDTGFSQLSTDSGRYKLNRVSETLNAFRTGSLRNTEFTKPYMHNGVFSTLSQVIDFYNTGGGEGRGLKVTNQTLSRDSLHLTDVEKNELIMFIKSLSENVDFESPPAELPQSEIEMLNDRKVGGEY